MATGGPERRGASKVVMVLPRSYFRKLIIILNSSALTGALTEHDEPKLRRNSG
jgi:hypothetical protein